MKLKWNPMTHAIFHGNLDMIKFLFENCHANSKKIIRVPGLYSTNEVNKLFPFYVALANSNDEMFDYFWSKQKQLNWNEDSFETLFTLLAKREASHSIPMLMRSETTHALFRAMSYSYKDQFIERLLVIQDELLDEITQMVKQYKRDHTSHQDSNIQHQQVNMNNPVKISNFAGKKGVEPHM